MKKLMSLIVSLIAASHGVTPLLAQTTATAPAISGDEQRVGQAKQQLAKDPKRAQAYDELALAYVRMARDTASPAYLKDADAAIARGLVLAPHDYQLEKAGVAVLLGAHEYAQALERARALSKRVPDDVTAYGYVAEADLALGNYAEAESSVQWMINMRPNNLAGLILGADLRAIYGDNAGALDFLNQAYSQTPQVDPEQQAYLAERIANVQLNAGQLDAAGQALARAEEVAPGLPATQLSLARVMMEQQKPSQAVILLEALLTRAETQHSSCSSILYLLGMAQQQAGQATSGATWARFVSAAEAEEQEPANDNVELVLYYAGSGHDAAKALNLAMKLASASQDAWTLDAYAWALYASGSYVDAERQESKALSVGIHSAQIADHAGEIALKLNKTEQAMQSFAAALQADPHSMYGVDARTKLGAGMQPADAPRVESATVAAKPDAVTDATTPALGEARDPGGVPTALLIPRPTQTDRLIKKMQGQVTAHPEDAESYSNLGAAFLQRARETGDVEDYQLAEQALTKSLDMVSTDLSATAPLETMAQVCMGEHRFTDALGYAQKALALGSGDLSPFATVGDAYADMGEYEKAGIAYSRLQPMTGTRAFNAREAYAQQTRTAYLAFVAGNAGDAVRQMERAVDEGVQAHLPGENLAWLYFELGEFSYQAGNISAAADAYLTALTVYPGDYRALAALGKVRASQGNYQDAITLYNSAIAVVPMPIYISELGDLYAAVGDRVDADKQYKLVEYIGRLGHINQVLHNRDLALFYADHDRNLGESLTLARKEFEVRSDIYTWDALAWSLYKNGNLKEADDAMMHAERLGTKDAMLSFHAGMISAKLGKESEATKQLNEALSINPQFSVLYVSMARKELAAMQAKSGGTLASVQGATHGEKYAHVQ